MKTPRFLILGSFCAAIAALYFAQDVLRPIALAILLSFLLAPLVSRIERLRLPRAAAVLLTVALAFAVAAGVGFVIYQQMADLAGRLPQYEANVRQKVTNFRGSGSGLVREFKHLEQTLNAPASQPATQPLQAVAPIAVRIVNNPATEPSGGQSSAGGGESVAPLELLRAAGAWVIGPLGQAFIIVVFTIFMLLDREDLRDRLLRLAGPARITVTTEALDDASGRISKYLVMQSLVNGIVGVLVMCGLWIVGRCNHIPFPGVALWGLMTALLRFIPYVGIWVAASGPLLISAAVYPSLAVTGESAAVFLAIEVTAANALEPMLYGSSTGVAPLAVLVAAAFWTWLWGTTGLLLSTPLTTLLVVMGKHVPQMEFLYILLGDEPVLDAPSRVYQRLLAGDEPETEKLIDEYSKKMTLEELYDTVLVPALAKSERDHYRGALDDDRLEAIQTGIRDIVEQLGDRERAAAVKAGAQATVDRAKTGDNTPAAPTPAESLPVPFARERLPKGCEINVVCLPAHDVADDLVSVMFAQLLELRGYCAHAVSVEQLASEMVETVARQKADVICISALPPAAVGHANYLCKRLTARFSDIGIFVGLWTAGSDTEERAKARLASTNGVQTTTTFRQALDQIRQLVHHKATTGTSEGSDAHSSPAR